MTDHTTHITVIAEYGSGPEEAIRRRYDPDGEHILFRPDATPDYVDDDGTEYLYTETSAEDGRSDALRCIENAPQITAVEVVEVVPIDEVGDRETVWRDEINGVAMVRTVPRSEALDGLERIEVEGDIDD